MTKLRGRDLRAVRTYCFCGYAWNGKKCRSLPRQPMRGGKNFWHHPDYESIGNYMTDKLAALGVSTEEGSK